MASDLRTAIQRALDEAKTGKGSQPGFLTAYQILMRVPEDLRSTLIEKHGAPGKGAGTHYSAASRIATELEYPLHDPHLAGAS